MINVIPKNEPSNDLKFNRQPSKQVSFYYKEQSTANSNSFKIAQKTAFEAKGRLYTTGKEIPRLFIIDLHTQLAIYDK